MASTEEEIGKGTKRVENSLFKGAGFNKSSNESSSTKTQQDSRTPSNIRPTGQQAGNPGNVDFESLPDNEKACWNYVAKNYDGVKYPENWAREHSLTSGLSEKGLASAANRFMQDFKKAKMSREETLKYPWWSAARDWSVEAIGGLGNKMSNGFKFDPDMVATASSRFY